MSGRTKPLVLVVDAKVDGLTAGAKAVHKATQEMLETGEDFAQAFDRIFADIGSASEVAIAVHGRADADDSRTVWMGGLHLELRDQIGAWLERAGFEISTDHHMQGKHPLNICNRGRLRTGAQLEMPRSLRNRFQADLELRQSFVAAVRNASTSATTAKKSL